MDTNNSEHKSASNFLSSKKVGSPYLVALAIFVIFATGFFVGQHNVVEAKKTFTLNPFPGSTKKPENANLDLFWRTWNLLDEKYVSTKASTSTSTKDSSENRTYGAIKGMVSSLGDPYTAFFSPDEAKEYELSLGASSLEGVGMQVGIKDGYIHAVTVYKDAPAYKAGIRQGDVIIKIGDRSTQGMSTEVAVTLIRGKKGTSVKLQVYREGNDKPFDVDVVRDVINIPSLESYLDKENNVYVIKLFSFGAQSASSFRNALKEFMQSNTNKLVIDMRGNGGGYLDAAVDIASWFLPSGKVVVREYYGAGKAEQIERSRGYNVLSNDVKVVVLIDGGSASASEILAGALQDHGKAKLVGTKTFGKAAVQEYLKLPQDSALKVTVARWLTPNGKSVSDGGVTPDYEVKNQDEGPDKGKDLQYQKAIELLR